MAGRTTPLVIANQPLPDRRLCGNGSPPAEVAQELRRALKYDATLVAISALQLALAAQPPVEGEFPPLYARGTRVGVKLKVEYSTLTWARRSLDDDNFWRGMKMVFDAWQEVGIVANDKQFYLNGKIEWVPVRTYSWGTVTATLTPDTEEDDRDQQLAASTSQEQDRSRRRRAGAES